MAVWGVIVVIILVIMGLCFTFDQTFLDDDAEAFAANGIWVEGCADDLDAINQRYEEYAWLLENCKEEFEIEPNMYVTVKILHNGNVSFQAMKDWDPDKICFYNALKQIPHPEPPCMTKGYTITLYPDQINFAEER
jgi:hypothetical protein